MPTDDTPIEKPRYHEVPVTVARAIAENFSKSQVVILAWDSVHQLTHTTTYGVTAADKENAAAAATWARSRCTCSSASSGS